MTIIVNARIVNEGRSFVGYVAFAGEFITAVGEGSPTEAIPADATIIDANGALLLPGAIDTHVHFREPGMTHKATIASESAAAVAGGVTSFLDMPNTNPPATTVEAVDMKKNIASRTSMANYGFFIGATNSNIDEILAADYTSIPGVKLFMGSSTGNMLVDRREALERLFAEFKGVIAVHAEDEAVIAENRRRLMEQYGEDASITLHSALRSREACRKSSSLAIELAKRHGSRLHILHISTADELNELSDSGIKGKRITAETCPHYLLFSEDDLGAERGYVRKCNPAIKTTVDRSELRRALVTGKVDIIATDHAPHRLEEKQGSLFKAASGMPGVKFSLPLMLDQTLDNRLPGLTVERVVELMCHNPALLYDVDRRGFIRRGYYADIVLVDPATRNPHTITDADSCSHLPAGETQGCAWTPYAGIQQRHRVLATFVNGSLSFDGQKVKRENRRALSLKFNH